MEELYEAVLAKAKNRVKLEKETSLSDGACRLISIALDLYYAVQSEKGLPPIVTAECRQEAEARG